MIDFITEFLNHLIIKTPENNLLKPCHSKLTPSV
jgi:hypothetical protein